MKNKIIVTIYSIFMLVMVSMFTVVYSNPTNGATIKYPGPYQAQVLRVIDGDTFIAYVNVWPTMFARLSIRINGIDTPESSNRFAKCSQEKSLGVTAKNWAKQYFAKAIKTQSTTQVRLANVKLGKYAGRVVADVEVKTGPGTWQSYNKVIIDKGYARPYFGKTKSDWCK